MLPPVGTLFASKELCGPFWPSAYLLAYALSHKRKPPLREVSVSGAEYIYRERAKPPVVWVGKIMLIIICCVRFMKESITEPICVSNRRQKLTQYTHIHFHAFQAHPLIFSVHAFSLASINDAGNSHLCKIPGIGCAV